MTFMDASYSLHIGALIYEFGMFRENRSFSKSLVIAGMSFSITSLGGFSVRVSNIWNRCMKSSLFAGEAMCNIGFLWVCIEFARKPCMQFCQFIDLQLLTNAVLFT